jgi:predicted permease
MAKSFPKDAHLVINSFILFVSLPSTALLHVPHIDWQPNLISVAFVAWIIFGFSYLFFTSIGNKLGWSKNVQGCLILTSGLTNSAFVGFPVIEALYGKENLKYAVLLDQPGSFLIVSTWAIWVATKFSGQELKKNELLKKILFFPPFLAFCSAILLGLGGWSADGLIKMLLERLASLLTPLAMISVGLQLHFKDIKADLLYLLTGLSFKLFLSPILIFLLYRLVGLPEVIFDIVVMEAAMATMITAGIVAQAHGLHPRLAGLMVGVSVPLSFFTLVLWYIFLSHT